ncbi:SRPBCC family protein [Reinekea marina]|uniref:SRPBCC domain-containing protein n=1 Tax=Reinekea marina TaxID=1310421 RepID=A0ABV7WUV3_9GAMM|nr:SRPBCC family protein [Reinekea marina]MDN3649182.1 SRPBCC family protein [Reinekea marina]
MTTAFTQEVTFKASLSDVFDAYINPEKHAAFTNDGAKITPKAGEPFSVHGGKIEGRFIDIQPNALIVQAWRPANWPENTYSIVKLEFSEANGECTITLNHTGCPEGSAEHLNGGWHKMYWEPLASWLEQQ